MATTVTPATGIVPLTTKVVGQTWPTSVALLLVTVLMIVAAWNMPAGASWLAVVLLMFIFIAILGFSTTRRVLGILINERKLMSLSRFQMVLWTLLLVSGYLVIALMRTRAGVADALTVTIEWQLWALLGINATALVGSPLLEANKKDKTPGKDAAQRNQLLERAARSLANQGETAAELDTNRQGLLYANADVRDARLTDMFQGDEVGNTYLIDVAKLQMFFFTTIVALVYAMQLLSVINAQEFLSGTANLPVLPEGMLALMGISNTAYLANKPIEHTPSS